MVLPRRQSGLNPGRPERVPGEEDHYRTPHHLEPGTLVRVTETGDSEARGFTEGRRGVLATFIGWDNTYSRPGRGRLAHIHPILAYPGTAVPDEADRVPIDITTARENTLSPAQSGDVSGHFYWPGHRLTPDNRKTGKASWLP